MYLTASREFSLGIAGRDEERRFEEREAHAFSADENQWCYRCAARTTQQIDWLCPFDELF